MAFPNTPLSITVTIGFDGSTPVDVSAYVRDSVGISRSVGRSGASSSTANAGKVTFSLQTAGISGYPDLASGTWNPRDPQGAYWRSDGWLGVPVVVTVEGTTWFTGRLSKISPTWDKDGYGYATVEASGPLRWIIKRGDAHSALSRAIVYADPVAYLPLDDGTDAARGGTIVPGFPGSIATLDPFEFSKVDGPPGAPEKLPEFASDTGSSDAAMTCQIAGDATSDWTIGFIFKAKYSAASGSWTPIAYTGPTNTGAFNIIHGSPSLLIVAWGSTAGGSLSISALVDLMDDQWHYAEMQISTDGADTYLIVSIDGVLIDLDVDTITQEAVENVVINGAASTAASTASLGHLAVHAGSIADMTPAMLGYPGETVTTRLTRLETETGITITVAGDGATLLGPQPSADLLTILRDVETADRGRLSESITTDALRYVTIDALYNLTPMALDAADLADTPQPEDEVGDRIGDVEVTRKNGSKYRLVDETVMTSGGTIAQFTDINVYEDGQLTPLAQFLLAQGSLDETRVGTIQLDLSIDSGSLIAAWLAAVASPPFRLTVGGTNGLPDELDLLVEGWSETIRENVWTANLTVTAARLYNAVTIGDTNFGRRDGEHTTIVSAIDADDTAVTIKTTSGRLWTSTAASMPYDAGIGGERVTVTAITGVGSGAVTLAGSGSGSGGNNATVSPGTPANAVAGDLVICMASIRNSGAGYPNPPSGWTKLWAADNCAIYGRIWETGDTVPSITFTGGVSGATTLGRAYAIRGILGPAKHAVSAAATQLNASAQNIAYPALTVTEPGCVILYYGWKADDYTSITTIAGATSLMENDTDTGDDAGQVIHAAVQTAAANIDAGEFAVNGGGAAISRGTVIALRVQQQVLTVTRSVNTVTKSHSSDAKISLWRPGVRALA